MSIERRKLTVTIEYQVEIEVDLDDEWTWDDIYEEALDVEVEGRSITDAYEVD